MKRTLRDLRRARLFPFIPIVPLAIIGGMLSLEIFALARLRRLARSVDELLEQQSELATT